MLGDPALNAKRIQEAVAGAKKSDLVILALGVSSLLVLAQVGGVSLTPASVDFGKLQKALEDKKLTPISAELEWIPGTTVPVTDAQAEDVSKLIERLEQDDDVSKVFHNMA